MKRILWVVLASFVSATASAQTDLVYHPDYQPPPCTGIFLDVPCPGMFADYIEQGWHEGLTVGCNLNPLLFCPDGHPTRATAMVFAVKEEHSILERTATGTIGCENRSNVTTIKEYCTRFDPRVRAGGVVMLTYTDDGTVYPARAYDVQDGKFSYEIQLGQHVMYLGFNPVSITP